MRKWSGGPEAASHAASADRQAQESREGTWKGRRADRLHGGWVSPRGVASSRCGRVWRPGTWEAPAGPVAVCRVCFPVDR